MLMFVTGVFLFSLGCSDIDNDVKLEEKVYIIDSKDVAVDSQIKKEKDEDIVAEIIEKKDEIELTYENVYWLQESLKMAGFYTSLDGSFGPDTKSKLIQFQEIFKIEVNLGIYDDKTRNKLKEIRNLKKSPNLENDMVLINKNYFLESKYIPDDLREVQVPKFKYMELKSHVALKVEEMFKDARNDGYELYFNSGYRSYEYQEKIFNRRVKSHGLEDTQKVIAIPGQSEHQTGLAFDVTCKSMDYGLGKEFENTDEFKWLINNCYKYGFILRYKKDKENITGYVYEPWHYRYIGDEKIAKEIMGNSMVFEEYLNQ
ncbi:D-alanyl-D-alanine carboxypeptidase family protein [Clostridiaceae bacterium HSG29]|nr:D-alanyl-D-alanine carboxypeptidase family protein [Clostridiaceae bacterium HSG29]